MVRDPERVVWISQTTLSVDETMETVRRLRERFPALQDPPSDDICYATQNRQVAVKKIAPHVRRGHHGRLGELLELGASGRGRAGDGARASYRVDNADEIDPAWLEGATTVGLTSGASVPEILVRDVLDLLAAQGFGEVEEVRTATEDLMFSLPRELRADLKAAGHAPARPRREGRRALDVTPA